MTEQDILQTLTTILRDLLLDQSIVLTPATTRMDVLSWDSFAYVNFIVAVESEFGVRFRVADVESFQTIGDLISEIKELSGRAT